MCRKIKLKIDLKNLRRKRGWNQIECAEKLGFSRAYLSAVENKKRNISMNMMEAIIEVFGVTYDDFEKEQNNS